MIFWPTEINCGLGILHDAMILWQDEINCDLGILHDAMILWQVEMTDKAIIFGDEFSPGNIHANIQG